MALLNSPRKIGPPKLSYQILVSTILSLRGLSVHGLEAVLSVFEPMAGLPTGEANRRFIDVLDATFLVIILISDNLLVHPHHGGHRMRVSRSMVTGTCLRASTATLMDITGVSSSNFGSAAAIIDEH